MFMFKFTICIPCNKENPLSFSVVNSTSCVKSNLYRGTRCIGPISNADNLFCTSGRDS